MKDFKSALQAYAKTCKMTENYVCNEVNRDAVERCRSSEEQAAIALQNLFEKLLTK